MNPTIRFSRIPVTFAALFLAALPLAAQSDAVAATGPLLVTRTGRSIPLSAVVLQGTNFTVKEAAPGLPANTVIPLNSIDHVSGEKPPELAAGTALLLMGQPRETIKKLTPLVASLAPTAKISGSYWIEIARMNALAYAMEKESAKSDALIKEISDATPATGMDPINRIAKVMALPKLAETKVIVAAYEPHIGDLNPPEISAIASYFKGLAQQEAKDSTSALRSFLTIGCLFPSGTVLLTSAGEYQAGVILSANKDRREEAVSLLKSAAIGASGTLIAEEAKKRLESLENAPTGADKPAAAVPATPKDNP